MKGTPKVFNKVDPGVGLSAKEILDTDMPITINHFVRLFPYPTEACLYRYSSHKVRLGLEEAFRKFGKKVLIKPKTLFRLMGEGCDESPFKNI